MKKRYILYLLCLLLILSGASCAARGPKDETGKDPQQNQPAGEDFENGVYSAAQQEFDDHGWKPMVTVVVEQGRISKAFYDEINEDGQLKSFDQDYLERWKEKSGENLLSAEPELMDSLVEKQDPEKVDAVSGATSTSEKFKELVSDALEETPQTKKDDGYNDGLFKAESEFDERGWKAYVAVIVEDGKITNAYYDEVDKETGKLKSFDQEYLSNWKEKSGTNLKEARPKLIDSLINGQSPEEVDAVSGATSTSTKFKELITEALMPLGD
jgi:major membrane immunogen (membrane-anchored lipoprotein)